MKKKIVSAAFRVVSWSPSRLGKWKECPAKVKYEDLLKMCPVCFKGRISGGFDGEPVVCDTCDGEQPKRDALDRGNMLDAALTKYLSDPKVKPAGYAATRPEEEQPLEAAVRHPAIAKLAASLRKAKASAQVKLTLNPGWVEVSKFTKGAWGRLTLDALKISKKVADVVDWKSGNIDKRTHEIRERDEYHDSMRAYQIAVLSTKPEVEKVTATMAFIDASPKLAEPFKKLPVLERRDLPDAQRDFERKLAPMFADTVFAPRPGIYCGWCGYSKKNGGPCPFGG